MDNKIIFVGIDRWNPNGSIEADQYNKPEDNLGATSQMKRVIAHEMGHFLHLSTRSDDTVTDGEGHDPGKFPVETIGLMRAGQKGGEGKWLRHEDWQRANVWVPK